MKIQVRCSATVNSRQADFRIKLIHREHVEILLGNSLVCFVSFSRKSVPEKRKA